MWSADAVDMMTLTEQDIARVSAALERYRIARGTLDSAADAEIATLQAHVASRRQHRRA